MVAKNSICDIDPFVLHNGYHRTSRPRSRELQRLGLGLGLKGLVHILCTSYLENTITNKLGERSAQLTYTCRYVTAPENKNATKMPHHQQQAGSSQRGLTQPK